MNDNSPTSDGRSGLRVVQVLEAAEESMRVGHAVDITALQAAS